MMWHEYKILIFLCIVSMILPSYAIAQGKLSDQSQLCLGCHSNKELKKPLENKETLSLYVSGEAFANSVHNPFNCSGCHTDISMANHPRAKKIASKKEYATNTSKSCKMCHPEPVLMKKPMHGKAATQPKAPACSECHKPHSIKRVAEWKAGMSDQQYCLTCHRHDLSMTLKSGDVYSLFVDESAFKSSAHGSLTCGVCHMGFSKDDHPMRAFKNKKEYAVNSSKSCKMCHPEPVLMKKPMHGKAITQAKAPACSECHTAHAVKRIKDLKAGIGEGQYCLMCHRHSLTMTLKSGESLALFVDEKLITKSVHGKLPCSNCHAGFSKDVHPLKVYKNKREYSTAMGNTCRKCHAEADKQYEKGIHFTVLREGNLKAPSCTDCHGSHSVTKATADKTFGLTACTKCHGDENKAYERSIHSKARTEGKENAPICSSCHKSHDVTVTAMTMKMKGVCLTCHKDIENAHKKWLSNPPFKLSSFAGLHLDTAACAACHSPGTKGGAFLCLYNRKTGKPFSEEEVLKVLGMDSAGLKKELDPLGKGVGSSEVWNMIKKLDEKGADVNFIGRLDVRKGIEAHLLAEKKKAVKDCEYCHRADSEFFKNVSIVLFKADGRPTYHNAKQEVLGSLFTILPASQFYVLGGTRIGLLDIIGIIAVLGGIAFPIGHITIRIVTSPIRTLRKMGKGGK